MNNEQKTTKKQIYISLISNSDRTIHSLNIQGTFFERWAQETVEKLHWDIVSSNYPVEFPPHRSGYQRLMLGKQEEIIQNTREVTKLKHNIR